TTAITTNATNGRSVARNTGRATARRARSRYRSAVAISLSFRVKRAHAVLAPHVASSTSGKAGGRRMLAAVPRSRRLPASPEWRDGGFGTPFPGAGSGGDQRERLAVSEGGVSVVPDPHRHVAVLDL